MLSDKSRRVLEAVGISPDDNSRIEVGDLSRVIDYLRKNFSASEVEDLFQEITRYAIDNGRSSNADLYHSSSMPRPAAPVTPDNSDLYLALWQFDSIFPKIMLDIDKEQIPGALIYSAMRYGLLLDGDLIRDWRIKNFYDGLWRHQNTLWFELSKHVNSEPMIWRPDDMTLLLLVRYKNQIRVNKTTSWYQYLKRFLSPFLGLLSLPKQNKLIDVFRAILKNKLPSYLVDISTDRKRNRGLARDGFLRLITKKVPPVIRQSDLSWPSEDIASRKQKRSVFADLVSHMVRTSDNANELIRRASTQQLSPALRSVIKCAAFYYCRDTKFGKRLKASGVLRIANNLSQRFEQKFSECDPECLSSDQLQHMLNEVVESQNNKSIPNLIKSLNHYLWYLHNENDRELIDLPRFKVQKEDNWLYPSMVMPWEYVALKNILYRNLMFANDEYDYQINHRMLIALILGYRSGLRRGEISSLRYRDIHLEGLPVIVITKHEGFSPKTRSGNRQVVVGGRYSDDEMGLIKELLYAVDENTFSDERHVFSGYYKLTDSTNNKKIFEEISKAIRFLTGDKNASFHSLRHSFASLNLYRMVRSQLSPEYLEDDNLNYDTGEDYSVYLRRLSPLPGATRTVNPVDQISAEMGHASPETTLGTYVHSLDRLFPYYQRLMMPTFSTAQLATALGVSRQAIQKTVKANGERNLADYRDLMVRKLKSVSANVDLSDWTFPQRRLRIGVFTRRFEFDGCTWAIRQYHKGRISLRHLLTLYPGMRDFPLELLRDHGLIRHFSRLSTNQQKLHGDSIIQRFSDLVPSEQRYCCYRWGISRDEWNSGGFNKPRLIFESKRTQKAYVYLANKLGVFGSAESLVVSC
ncbi:site-specific integrase [Thalassolituus sp. LLYu03]|uniref:site-specific integrase n=1 Tax=Thalassolituus sp. LLYu03 TaxID=3421656 RepID=UPI003D278E22